MGDVIESPAFGDTALHHAVASAARTLEIECKGLDAARQALSGELGESFLAAARLIQSVTGNVIITGMGKSGHVGHKIAATLASTGTPSHFVHPPKPATAIWAWCGMMMWFWPCPGRAKPPNCRTLLPTQGVSAFRSLPSHRGAAAHSAARRT